MTPMRFANQPRTGTSKNGVYIKKRGSRGSVAATSIPSTLNNLGILYEAQGKFEEAEQFYREGLEILQSTVGDEHPNTQHVKRSLESLLSKLNEAETPPTEDSDR